MKWTVISLLFFIPPLCGSDVKPRQHTQAELAEFQAQQKAKAQAALANRLQEQAQQTRADAAVAQQLSGQENGQLQRQLPTAAQEADAKKTVAKKNADQELEDACEILFKLQPHGDGYLGQGLPKNLQNIVFDKLQEMHSVVMETNHYERIGGLATHILADGTFNIISGSFDGLLNVTNSKTGKQICPPLATNGSVRALITHTDAKGTHFTLCASDNEVQIWDTMKGVLVRTLSDHRGSVRCLATYSDKQDNWYVVSCSNDRMIHVWNGKTGELIHQLKGHNTEIFKIKIFQDLKGNCFIISTSNDVRVWNASTGALLHTLRGHQGWIQSLALFSDAQGEWYIVSGSRDGTIRVWNGTTGKLLKIIEPQAEVGVVHTYTDKNGNSYIIAGTFDGKIRIWNATNGQLLYTLEGHTKGVKRLAVHTDSQGNWYVVSGSHDRTICIWDGALGKLLQKLEGHEYSITALNLIDAGGTWHIISGSIDTTVRRWSFGPGQFEQALIDEQELQAQIQKNKEVQDNKEFEQLLELDAQCAVQ